MPATTRPQIVYWLSRLGAGPNMMKNWLLALLGLLVRAMPQVPRTKRALFGGENSAGRSSWPCSRAPPVPVPVRSPPWAMKPSITRWKGVPS